MKQPCLKKGGESSQSPPVLLEVLGKLSLHPCIRALFKGDLGGAPGLQTRPSPPL